MKTLRPPGPVAECGARGHGLGSPDRFADAAVRLAGFAGVALGWSPDAFWRATPAELTALVAVLDGVLDGVLHGGGAPPPPDAATISKLQEAFPDG